MPTVTVRSLIGSRTSLRCDGLVSRGVVVVGSPPARPCGRRSGPAAVDVVVDVEVEVDADPLEEVVVERDEADFDRHLQVLQPPQLFQQVDDFLVDFLRLADDQAQVGLERGDRARAADVVPGGGLDGRR